MQAAATISVVIPCFNAQRYVAAAIESVLAQQWPGVEVIVVDDGSSDDSAATVDAEFSAGGRVRLLRQPNQGAAAARNHGIRAAQGEWIAFLDADDIWLPGKLLAQHRLLAGQPEARMSYTAWKVWTSTQPAPTAADVVALLEDPNGSSEPVASGWIYPRLLLGCAVWTSSVLVHRSVFAEVGVFDESLRIGEDWDLWLRASRVTPILQVTTPCALYRLHPANVTKRALERNYHELVVSRAIGRWGYKAPDGTSADKFEVDRHLARSWTDFAGSQLAAGNVRRARHGAVMSLRADARQLQGWKVLAKAALRSLVGAPVPRG